MIKSALYCDDRLLQENSNLRFARWLRRSGIFRVLPGVLVAIAWWPRKQGLFINIAAATVHGQRARPPPCSSLWLLGHRLQRSPNRRLRGHLFVATMAEPDMVLRRQLHRVGASESVCRSLHANKLWLITRYTPYNKQHAHGAPMIGPEMCVPSLYRLAMAQLAAREFPALPELPLGLEFPTFLERLLLDK